MYPDADDLLPENILELLEQADEMGAETLRFHFIECFGSIDKVIEVKEGFPIGPHFKAVKVKDNITFIGIILLIVRKQIVNIKYFLIAFILYCICAPITEFFCFDFNGPLNNLFNKCKTNNLTKKEQEVSRKKLKTRIIIH